MADITFPDGFDKNCTSDRQRAGKMISLAFREMKKGDFDKEDLKPFIDWFENDYELTSEVAIELIEQYFTIV